MAGVERMEVAVELVGDVVVVEESGEAGFVPVGLFVVAGCSTGGWVGVAVGVGVGHGFSREVHSCQGASGLPPNSFQRARQHSLQ